jgi:hypothetical protein
MSVQFKKDEMARAGHVAQMGGKGIHIGFWLESQKETDH